MGEANAIMARTSSTVKNRYNAKAYDQLPIRVMKGHKALIQAAADEQGESLNEYVKTAIKHRMGLEAWPEKEDADA